jgi:hypothetical protein
MVREVALNWLFPDLNFFDSAQCLMVRRWRLIGHFPILYNPPPRIKHHKELKRMLNLGEGEGIRGVPVRERIKRTLGRNSSPCAAVLKSPSGATRLG